jgi:hypothetical protein
MGIELVQLMIATLIEKTTLIEKNKKATPDYLKT